VPQKSEQAILDEANACRGLNAVITAATTCSHNFDEYPDWMRFTLDDAMIDTLLRLRAVCATNGLSDASVYQSCDVGPISGDNELCRTELDALRVFVGGFFVLEANVRNCDSHFATVPLYFDDFFADVAAGRRFIGGDGHDEGSDADLKETVEEQEAEMAVETDADGDSDS
jgi:hypothetical protein